MAFRTRSLGLVSLTFVAAASAHVLGATCFHRGARRRSRREPLASRACRSGRRRQGRRRRFPTNPRTRPRSHGRRRAAGACDDGETIRGAAGLSIALAARRCRAANLGQRRSPTGATRVSLWRRLAVVRVRSCRVLGNGVHARQSRERRTPRFVARHRARSTRVPSPPRDARRAPHGSDHARDRRRLAGASGAGLRTGALAAVCRVAATIHCERSRDGAP